MKFDDLSGLPEILNNTCSGMLSRGGWLGPGLAPRTRPGDPTNDSRSGDRPELARPNWLVAGLARTRDGSECIVRAQTPGRKLPLRSSGGFPAPPSTLASAQALATPRSTWA